MTNSVDDDMDQQLRQWADNTRAQAPRASIPDFDDSRHAGRRTATMLGTAATVVIIAIGASVLGVRAHHSVPPGPTTGVHRSHVADPHPADAGQREWRFRGLAVDVPLSWPANDEYCGSPQHDTVLINQGPQGACAAGVPRDIAWVEFDPLRDVSASTYPFFLLPHAATRQTTVGGLPAQRSEGVSHIAETSGRYIVIIAVPRLHAAVSFVAPAAAQARHLATTLHRVPPTPGGARGVLDGTLKLSRGRGRSAEPERGVVRVCRNPSSDNAAPLATTRTNQSGHFSFTLPPGSYFLKATIDSLNTRTPADCANHGSDTVTDAGTSITNLICQ